MPLDRPTEIGLGPGHIVLDGDPAPPPQKKGGTAPQFSALVCCGQTVWIKMPHGTEIGLAPYDIVRIPLFLAISTAFQTLSSNRHCALLSASDFHA